MTLGKRSVWNAELAKLRPMEWATATIYSQATETNRSLREAGPIQARLSFAVSMVQ